MPRTSYVFGPFTFTSQNAVKSHARAVRERYARGELVHRPEDVAFLDGLISRHIERDAKIGCGVLEYYWDRAPDHPSDCFFVRRRDGTRTDFGVPSCFATIRILNLQSLRMVIRPQILAYRESRVPPGADFVLSEFSQLPVPVSQVHVDHIPPFDDLVAEFCKRQGIDLDTELLTVSADLRSQPVWKSGSVRDAFTEFHRQKARLRLVSDSENLSAIRRQQSSLLG